MAINKKLIHYQTDQAFQTDLEAGNIQNYSIVFLKESHRIYTHGEYYDCGSREAEAIVLSEGYTMSDLTNMDLEPKPGDSLETAIGKLHKAILDNEEVVSQAFVNMQNSLGLVNPSSALPDLSDTHYMADIKTVIEGLRKIDEAVYNAGILDFANYLAKNNTTEFTPTGNYNPATKKYVDDAIAAIPEVDTSNLATKQELTDGLAGKANSSHTHTASQVSGLSAVATSGSYNDLSNKPSIPTVPSGTSNAVADYNRNTGHNTATSLSNVATSKRLVIATISSNQSFSVANNPGDGKELHIIVRNTSSSDRTVSMPTRSTYVNMSGDSLTIPGGGYAEINVVFDNSYRYIRFAAQE